MAYTACSFFLGANSRHGFVSFFDSFAAEDSARRVFLLKSGPGCGKSTVIRRVHDVLAEDGGIVENILCSGDPASLDGMTAGNRQVALLDATAPHVLESTFHGAHGGYLTLPEPLDRSALEEKYPALLAFSAASKEHYAQAYRLIAASAQVDEYITRTVQPHFDAERFTRRAKGIIAREIPQNGRGRGMLKKRFIDGITPDGVVRLSDTVNALCSRVYELCDSCGFAHLLLQPLLEGALSHGWDVYACFCPKTPDRLLHLLIPGLSLGFITSTPELPYTGSPFRRIRVDACIDHESRRSSRGQVRLLSRLSQSLIEDAVAEIAAAHTLHDRMEELYRPHIDFAALDARTEEIAALLSR